MTISGVPVEGCCADDGVGVLGLGFEKHFLRSSVPEEYAERQLCAAAVGVGESRAIHHVFHVRNSDCTDGFDEQDAVVVNGADNSGAGGRQTSEISGQCVTCGALVDGEVHGTSVDERAGVNGDSIPRADDGADLRPGDRASVEVGNGGDVQADGGGAGDGPSIGLTDDERDACCAVDVGPRPTVERVAALLDANLCSRCRWSRGQPFHVGERR